MTILKPDQTKCSPDQEKEENHCRFQNLLIQAGVDRCLSCGACVAGCPVSDWCDERLDPRRMIRLLQYGLGDLLTQKGWIWQCTNCGKCSYNCPVGVDLESVISTIRGFVPKDKSPGQIQKTADLHRSSSNNMGLTVDDWLETVDWMADELRDEIPDLELPIDKHGAELFITINSKLPMYYPGDLQDIFKILHTTGVSWTLTKKWWEGTNYAMFTGDEDTWEKTLRNQVEVIESLGCKTLAYTECGHGYYATLLGYKKFDIRPDFEITHVVNLYAKWIREGRFRLDASKNTQKVTLHDPCNVVRKASRNGFPSIAEDSRYVLSKTALDFVEMTPNREANYCCSGGGGALLAGFKKARTYYGKAKVDQVDRTSAESVCTPCVNCYDAITGLSDEYKRNWKPVHLWKLLSNAIIL